MTQSPQFTLEFTLGVHSVGLNKWIMNAMCLLWYHRGEFHAQKNPLFHLFKPPLPLTLATTDLFTIFIVLFFPDCPITGIIGNLYR